MSTKIKDMNHSRKLMKFSLLIIVLTLIAVLLSGVFVSMVVSDKNLDSSPNPNDTLYTKN